MEHCIEDSVDSVAAFRSFPRGVLLSIKKYDMNGQTYGYWYQIKMFKYQYTAFSLASDQSCCQ